MGEEERKLWIQLMEKEMKLIGDESTIPDYGGVNKTEFFAVVSEYYKECPKLLKIKHPQLYEVLYNYYNQSDKNKG
jgi:Mlc titration factor MtfA (ptsG expression regulator)